MLSFCNARQMTSPAAYIHYSPDIFTADGDVTIESTKEFLTNYLTEFRDQVVRVLTVLPRDEARAAPSPTASGVRGAALGVQQHRTVPGTPNRPAGRSAGADRCSFPTRRGSR